VYDGESYKFADKCPLFTSVYPRSITRLLLLRVLAATTANDGNFQVHDEVLLLVRD